MRSLLLTFLLIVSLFSCSEDRDSVGFPSVTMSDFVDVSDDGALVSFSVDHIGNNTIQDCGVVYWLKNNGSEIYTVSLGKQVGKSLFSVPIISNLVIDEPYVVKAYVQTSNHTVYGSEVTFLSRGGKAPEIHSVEPLAADLGDTLFIRGKYFSAESEMNKVELDDKSVDLIYSSDTLIKVLVPQLTKASDVAVSVTATGKKAVYIQPFSLAISQIDSIVPLVVYRGDELKLYGRNLRSLTAVKIGDYVYSPKLESAGTLARIKLNNNISVGPQSLAVSQINREINLNRTINVVEPKILSVAPSVAWVDTVLQIKGQYLSRIKNLGIDDAWWGVTIISQTDTLIKMRVNAIFYEGLVAGYFLDNKVSAPSRIRLNPPVVESITPSSATYGETVTLTGDRFFNGLSSTAGELTYISKNEMRLVVGGDLPSGENLISFRPIGSTPFPASNVKLIIPEIAITGFSKTEIWRGDQITMSTKNMPNSNYSGWYYPWVSLGGQSVSVSVLVDRDEIKLKIPLDYLEEYPSLTLGVGVQITTIENVLHVIEPWSKPKSTNELEYPVFVSSNDRTYAFVYGYTGGNLYFFNPESEKWEFESQLSASPLVCDKGVSVGADLYFFGSVSEGEVGNAYKYSIVNKTWTRLPDLPVSLYAVEEFAFSLNNKLYMGTGAGLYSFDETDQMWEEKASLPMSGDFFTFPCNFSINGKGYVALHSLASYDDTPNVLWEYNPEMDSWTNLYASFSYILMHGSGVVYGDKAYLVGETNEYPYMTRVFEFDPENKQIIEFLQPPLNSLAHVFVEGEYLYGASSNSVSKIPLVNIPSYFK